MNFTFGHFIVFVMEVYHVTLFYVPIFFLTPLCVAVHVYILAINRFLVTVSKPVF